MTATPGIDLLSEGFFANPFPTFERLRTEAPVYYFEPFRCFILTRAADIEQLVKNPKFTSRRARELLGGLGILGDDEDSKKMLADWSRLVFFQDPPRHAQLRQLIMKGFSPGAVERVRPRVAVLVHQSLEKARRQGATNIVADLAEPVALNTIAELFALPEADRPRFMKWSSDMLKPAGVGVNADEARRSVKKSSNDMVAYIRALVEERRRTPGEDLISRFIAEEDANSGLAGEAALQTFQMVGAGFVTSQNQISNMVLALLRHPEALATLRARPDLVRSAVEESLRVEPSVMSINRMCAEDTELHGMRISQGQFVYAMVASANRESAVFPEPERFDLSRTQQRHMTFGVGVHYCPGAPLIRLEMEEALRGLLSFPHWELGDVPFDYQGSNFQDRGPSSLHVRFAKDRHAYP